MSAKTTLASALNVKPVTNLLEKEYRIVDGKRTLYPLLFETQQIDPAYESKSDMINYYYVSGDASGATFVVYSLQCRANDESKSMRIAQSVKTALNRVFSDGVYFRTEILQSIPEAQNAWNTPVEVKLFSGEHV